MLIDKLCILFILIFGLTSGNNTTADDGSLEELELELVEEPEKKARSRGSNWSGWSTWSPCSRTCDGGVSFQLRACQSRAGCHGEPVRHKICNMQPCPESVEYREEQCRAFNSVPYHDTFLHWSAHHDAHEPCALTCRGRPLREWQDSSHPDTDDEALIVVQLAPKVQDGTRCRTGSLDMCIDGQCQRVGCDLRIGSTRRVDECGICGGDGSSCVQPLYHWTQTAASLCSATCGGGYKMSRPLCKNRISDTEVEEFLCNMAQRPQPNIVECNNHACPAQWITDVWGPCSLSCGAGVRFRDVYCSQQHNSSSFKVAENRCSNPKPAHEEACEFIICPKWTTSDWSQCSVSCGEGVQTRSVTCTQGDVISSLPCADGDRPAAVQPCSTVISCPLSNYPYPETDLTAWDSHSEPEGDYHQPLLHPYPPLLPEGHFMSGYLPATAEKLVGAEIEPATPSEATFIAEEWGPCNVSCGEGVRRREVHCKIFLEFSRAIARLPDQQCSGPKPQQLERCVREPCAMDNRMELDSDRAFSDQLTFGQPQASALTPNKTTYSWKENGWTHCSVSCLGGAQELIITCVRDRDRKTVSPMQCNSATRPENLVRTCNDFPCPPRWNISEFQPCTKSCGIGIQLREVNCIHEVTRGPENTIVVPNSMCPIPEPPGRQYCNVLDCPIRWHTGNWSKCSKPCGQGIKTRNVTCQQIMAQDRVIGRKANLCSPIKPPDKKPCNAKPCLETERPFIASDPNQSYTQASSQKKRINLKIGGSAHVYLGTQVKIKCPVKRYDRAKIKWEKDNAPIDRKSTRIHVSNNGALKINKMGYPDNGVYTCIAGKSSANISLYVRPLPGYPTSEEIHQAQNQVDNPAYHESNTDLSDMGHHKQPFILPGDDISHELKPDSVPLTKKPRDDLQRLQMKATVPAATVSTPGQLVVEDEERSVRHSETPFETPSDPSSSSPSGGSRMMPHFQQLLLNLQMFGSSRGHRALSPAHDIHLSSYAADHSFPLLGDVGDADDDELGPAVVLGSGNAENLKFEWVLTQWTQCSEPCGSTGFQMRSAHCMLRLHNTTQYVGDNFCEDAGLSTPTTVQKCGEDCPQWTHSSWSSCEESRCFTWNTAMQRRDVTCVISNGTEVDYLRCPADEKPTQRQECYNDKCKGIWKVGEWSECAAECEQEGIKYRILQCVWYGTKKPAGNACRDQPRPSVMKVCKGPPCSVNGECKDHSKFCHSVLSKNMCRVYRFQTQCCHTCRGRLVNLG